MKCEEAREMLPAYAGTTEGNLSLRRHLARCSDCLAEMERFAALTTALKELPGAVAEPPAMLVRALHDIPESSSRLEEARRHLTRHKRRYAAGGLAVALVGAAGAAVLARRPRAA